MTLSWRKIPEAPRLLTASSLIARLDGSLACAGLATKKAAQSVNSAPPDKGVA